jgi:hypothetical protein
MFYQGLCSLESELGACSQEQGRVPSQRKRKSPVTLTLFLEYTISDAHGIVTGSSDEQSLRQDSPCTEQTRV